MELLILFVFLGVIVGTIAQDKGLRFWPWFWYGALLFIIAIIHVLVAAPHPTKVTWVRKCPFCASAYRD